MTVKEKTFVIHSISTATNFRHIDADEVYAIRQGLQRRRPRQTTSFSMAARGCVED